MNKLNEDVFNELLSGFSDACRNNNCALIGGETAQLPDLYAENEYDLSGTVVGVVDQDKIIDGSKVVEGDYIIGLHSDGLHTNGYTLARKALGDNVDKYSEELLKIHVSYLKAFNACRQYIKAAAHITGGGLIDNIPRTLPPQFKAVIQKKSWTVPDIFRHIQSANNIPDEEMYKVFNMGIGMTWIVSVNDLNYCVSKLSEFHLCTIIGRVEKRNNNVVLE